jgi:hypothetical protein
MMGKALCLNHKAEVVLAKVHLYHVKRKVWFFIYL